MSTQPNNQEQRTNPAGIDVNQQALGTLFTNAVVEQATFHINVQQKGLFITEDKGLLILSRCAQKMESRNAWLTPFGLLVSILLTLVTAEFKTIVLSADAWQAIFIVGAVINGAWLLQELRHRHRAMTAEDVMAELQRGARVLGSDTSPGQVTVGTNAAQPQRTEP